MKLNNFTISQKITGLDRKVLAGVIAEKLHVKTFYPWVPFFSYKIGGWMIGKDNILKSPEMGFSQLKVIRPIMEGLKIAGATTEGQICITISNEGYSKITIANISSLIKSKEILIKKALSIVGGISVTQTNTEIKFDFFNATPNPAALEFYIAFVWKISEQQKC